MSSCCRLVSWVILIVKSVETVLVLVVLKVILGV